MSEFEKILRAVPNSYDNFVQFCLEEFSEDAEKQNKLIDYIKSRVHENPGDIVKYISIELLNDLDEE